MKFDYNKLVQKVDSYLRRKRSESRAWQVLLPERLFSPELWLWTPRGVATGAAWGTCWAIAPVPLQMVFAVLSCIERYPVVHIFYSSAGNGFPHHSV